MLLSEEAETLPVYLNWIIPAEEMQAVLIGQFSIHSTTFPSMGKWFFYLKIE
ncbi:hypothetical protein NC99_12190 [Sunxiuqinia dokdonensis]|uniref:Uncharacterized protein n=1 Tax=Sunxiuqinia dokdonensis TaxID=1409788 RepID=A0A0L8VBZ4_9BACT|nr:hypothetical protein NC99_12190 [Sunxiuqinia dokdonensis]